MRKNIETNTMRKNIETNTMRNIMETEQSSMTNQTHRPLKRLSEGRQFIKNTAQSPNIRLLGIRLSLTYFRGDVTWSADNLIMRGVGRLPGRDEIVARTE